MAALGAIANTQPAVINNMFTANSNGTYGVTFYKSGSPVYSTVNTSLAVNSSGKLALAGDVNKSLTGELWVSLAEKPTPSSTPNSTSTTTAANGTAKTATRP